MAQLKYVQNKSEETFRDACELASRKAESLGTELKRPVSVLKHDQLSLRKITT
jgi:hypothetical protein